MNVSLISPEFICFSALAILLLSASSGLVRQVVFLLFNGAFVYWVLGPKGAMMVLGLSALGFAFATTHKHRPELSIWVSVTALVLIFIYLRNYELLGFILPDTWLQTALSTVGLSFLLFKILHVLIDLKGSAISELRPLTYFNYCFNFTTFMMGPIQRFQDYDDQWHGRKVAIPLTFEAHLDASIRILWGLVKIYVIGAQLGKICLQSDTDVTQLSLLVVTLKLYAFYFFLYANFSGYCDVVIGIGSLFGVRPPENFNLPFLAQNISDFWLRQHRSLTLWLTDYVFTPTFKSLLEQRWFGMHTLLAGLLAICVTMFISGVWHGTTLGFAIFGIVHGAYFVFYRTWDYLITERFGKKYVREMRKSLLGRAIGIFLTFNAAAFAFLFFQLDTPRLMSLFESLVG